MTGGKYDDTYLFANSVPEPIPGDPVPVPDPIPRPNPCLTHHPMKNRLNCRIVSVICEDTRLLTLRR